MAKEDEAPIQQRIKVVPYTKELTIYNIDGEDLDNLAKGVPIPLYLNLSLFLLSFSGSLIGSMLPSVLNVVPCSRLITYIFIGGLAGLAGGIVLLVLWMLRRKKVADILNRIKNQKPPDGTPAA